MSHLFLPFIFRFYNNTTTGYNDDVSRQNTEHDPNQETSPQRERIILVNPFTQALVVMEGASNSNAFLRGRGTKTVTRPLPRLPWKPCRALYKMPVDDDEEIGKKREIWVGFSSHNGRRGPCIAPYADVAPRELRHDPCTAPYADMETRWIRRGAGAASSATNLKLAISTRFWLYLVDAGFGHIARYECHCKIEPNLISALVERWRPETHTFHLSCRECTITLENVSMHLGLPVDGDMISGMAHGNWTTLCQDYLGGMHTAADRRVADARQIAQPSSLEMCRTTDYRKNAIGRCLLLLQSWAWYRLLFLCPVVKNSFVFPLLLRKNHRDLPDELEIIMLLIDQKAGTEFEWVSYSNDDVRMCIPPEMRGPSDVWMVVVPLICTSGSSSAAPPGPSQQPSSTATYMPQPYMMPPPPFPYQTPSPPPSQSYMTPHGGYYGSMFADPTWGSYAGYLFSQFSMSSRLVSHTPPGSLFYRGATSSSVPHQQNVSAPDDDEDDNDGDDSEESQPVIRRNPPRDRQPPPCRTHSHRRHR
ncbi:glutathione S-transferase T2-like [Hibiscus syriacus]|uniref:Glutathione S-transferase T2-like n=1 Tax=Hibiscus syriacus TaxID=106335 RepID=A0A6A3AUH1_HIBSY|nr:glutathione S-transferase T2-like [Hibiscus syriacus]